MGGYQGWMVANLQLRRGFGTLGGICTSQVEGGASWCGRRRENTSGGRVAEGETDSNDGE